jgi:hypothetical protein
MKSLLFFFLALNCLLNLVRGLVHLQDNFQIILKFFKLVQLILTKLNFLVAEAWLIRIELLGKGLLNRQILILTFMKKTWECLINRLVHIANEFMYINLIFCCELV